MMTSLSAPARIRVVRRGQWLTWATLAYNSLEGLLSIGAGIIAGSVALIGFGVDSFIEVTASLAAIWRLRADSDPTRRSGAERRALRVIGVCFLALAVYVAADAGRTLIGREPPQESVVGMVIAALSLIVMPLLARAKRQVATALSSRAIHAEARQTDICMYLSAILLGGLVLNALFTWWWADPVAAVLMVPLIAREGLQSLRGHAGCDDCVIEGAA
jgi:divalent metal cation (Fe/Co/Zn/Cd) transporter